MNIDDKIIFNRLLRQLSERSRKVELGQRNDKYYQNKRDEFIKFIDNVIKKDSSFVLKEGTRLYKIYHDKWN